MCLPAYVCMVIYVSLCVHAKLEEDVRSYHSVPYYLEYLQLYLELGFQLGLPARVSDICSHTHVDAGNRTHVLVIVHTAGSYPVNHLCSLIVFSFTKTINHIEKLYYEIWSLLLFEIELGISV